MDDDAKITPRQIGVHPHTHVINMVSFGTFCGIPRSRWDTAPKPPG